MYVVVSKERMEVRNVGLGPLVPATDGRRSSSRPHSAAVSRQAKLATRRKEGYGILGGASVGRCRWTGRVDCATRSLGTGAWTNCIGAPRCGGFQRRLGDLVTLGLVYRAARQWQAPRQRYPFRAWDTRTALAPNEAWLGSHSGTLPKATRAVEACLLPVSLLLLAGTLTRT